MLGRIALYGVLVLSVFGLSVVLVLIEYRSVLTGEYMPAQPLLLRDVSATAWGVFDPESGKILLGRNEDSERPIASLTKLFTAGVVMQDEGKHESFRILATDLETEGRAGRLALGLTMTPYELLFPLLLESSNDAGEAIRRHMGQEFETARGLLMGNASLSRTRLVDGSGLSPLNVSTVRDLALFYSYLKREDPHLLDITRLRMYIGDHGGYLNNNPAHRLSSFRGGKNGYLPEAGRTFIGTFKEGDGDGEIGIVLLGSTDIPGDIGRLLPWEEEVPADSDIMRP